MHVLVLGVIVIYQIIWTRLIGYTYSGEEWMVCSGNADTVGHRGKQHAVSRGTDVTSPGGMQSWSLREKVLEE